MCECNIRKGNIYIRDIHTLIRTGLSFKVSHKICSNMCDPEVGQRSQGCVESLL